MTAVRSQRVDFFQLISWLQRSHPDRAEVGHVGARGLDVGDELLRLRPNLSLGFPLRDVERIERMPSTAGRHERLLVELNFGGVYGADSPLPWVFTEALFVDGAAEGEDRAAVRDFLDVFHHRLYSLVFRSWEKRRYHATFRADGRDDTSRMIAALVGLGTSGTVEAAEASGALRRSTLMRLGALATQRPRSIGVLRAALQDHLGSIPVRMESFVPRRVEVEPRDRTHLTWRHQGVALGDGGAPGRRLGIDAVLGTTLVERSSTIRVHVGPLSLRDYEDLLPGCDLRRGVDALLRGLAPSHIRYEVALELGGREVPPLILSERSDIRLGWTSWVVSRAGASQCVTFPEG